MCAIALVATVAASQAPAPPAAGTARFADSPAIITEAECTAARLGTSIPGTAIGEPVSSVTLAEPKWTAAGETAPARCEVDGEIAPVSRAPTARPIRFRVWLPASWNRRAAQVGGAA